MSALNPTIITFLFYIVAMIVIGLLAYRATRNFSDYILGGRRLGSFVTALSAGASDMSGWLLMGLPGAIYLSGLSEMWIADWSDYWRMAKLAFGGRSFTSTHRSTAQCTDFA